jgi:hypothetical protein
LETFSPKKSGANPTTYNLTTTTWALYQAWAFFKVEENIFFSKRTRLLEAL